MKLTIIISDKAVYVDGICHANLDVSNAPSNVHALQFNSITNTGWIEFKEDAQGNTQANQIITDLPDWALNCKKEWQIAKDKDKNLPLITEQRSS